MNFDSDRIEACDEIVYSLIRIDSCLYSLEQVDLEQKNRPSPPANPSIEERPMLELKELLGHLKYVFLGESTTFLVILVANLVES